MVLEEQMFVGKHSKRIFEKEVLSDKKVDDLIFECSQAVLKKKCQLMLTGKP